MSWGTGVWSDGAWATYPWTATAWAEGAWDDSAWQQDAWAVDDSESEAIVADAGAVTDAVTEVVGASNSVTETGPVADTEASVLAVSLSVSDASATADVVTPVSGFVDIAADAADATEGLFAGGSSATESESSRIVDSGFTDTSFPLDDEEAAGSDLASTNIGANNRPQESSQTSDTAIAVRNRLVTVPDSVTATDMAPTNVDVFELVADTTSGVEAISDGTTPFDMVDDEGSCSDEVTVVVASYAEVLESTASAEGLTMVLDISITVLDAASGGAVIILGAAVDASDIAPGIRCRFTSMRTRSKLDSPRTRVRFDT